MKLLLALFLALPAFGQILSPIQFGQTAAVGGCSLSFTTGLSLWVKADAGLTCTGGCTGTNTVTAWADQSGNGNNLTTSSSTLTYAAADINGLPAVHFDMTGATPGPSSFTLTTGLTPTSVTIFAVLKNITGTTRGTIISGATGSLQYFVNDGGSNVLQGANSTFNALLLNGTAAQSAVYHQVNFTGVSGTSQALRQNRTADGTATTATSFAGAAMTTIGYNKQAGTGGCALPTSCESLSGNLAELLVYSAALSGTNNTTVENYLNCRYGL